MTLYLAFLAYLAAMLAASIRNARVVSAFSMGLGLVCTVFVFSSRYLEALPMMPLHLGMLGIAMVLNLIWCFRFFRSKTFYTSWEGLGLQACLLLLILTSILFPKDFYLPFIRSLSPWAHLFLVLGIPAKGLLLYGAMASLPILLQKKTNGHDRSIILSSSMQLITWGYGFLALTMFSGEIWSYLGWGTPVVWHDAAITTTIGLWFYWTCFLHLHYLRSWSADRRALFVVVGGLLTLAFSIHPDMGPFRPIHFSG